MFSRLKTFVFGGAAGSVDTEQTDNPANNIATPSVSSNDRWMKRAKRKRQDEGHAQGEESSEHAEIDTDSRNNGEPLAKKTKTNVEATAQLTPSLDQAASMTATSSQEQTSSRKRRGSHGSAHSETPIARRRRMLEDAVVAPPRIDESPEEQSRKASDDLTDLQGAASLSYIPDNELPPHDNASPSMSERTPRSGKHAVAGNLAAGLKYIAREYRGPAVSGPHALRGGADNETFKQLHRRSKKCLKRIRADRKAHDASQSDDDDDDDDEKDDPLSGINSWPGSSTIPGSLRQGPAKAGERVELPRIKPHRVDWSRPTAGGGALCGTNGRSRTWLGFIRVR